jgi:5-methylcytosine-specific restriction protein B
MTVTEILRTITEDDILNAINNYVFNETSRQGRPVNRFVSYENKDYPAKELLKQATPSLINASNYSNNSYTSNVAQQRLEELGFTVNKKSRPDSFDWTYYIKRVLNQDVERSFSISNEAATAFFYLQLNNGQDEQIELNYIDNNQILTTRFNKRNTRNEYRFFPDYHEQIEEDDILLFKSSHNGYCIEYSIEIIKKNNESFDGINNLLELRNHLLTNSLTPNKSTQMKTNIISMHPLNQILFGPPGTGKTYNTIIKSLQILSVDYTDYDDALDKFQQELGNRIEFVSMHQSFSYEDFVQGLRPRTLDGTIQFEYVDGVFKKICSRASEALTGDRSEVDDIQISNSEIVEIAFFLSKFNGKKKDQKQGVHLLGYQSDDEAFRRIGEKIGIKPNSLKNHRDKFDFIFNDRLDYTSRKGWTPRNKIGELDNTGLWPYQDFYNKLNGFDINQLSDRVLVILNNFDSAAIRNPDGGNFVIVLDEINRANISKVFGELITLIEEDKRENLTVRLPSGDFFTVPSNLYIIGTMNTADKSVSMVDIALRRRFEFEAMYPDPKLVSDPKKKKFMIDLNREIIDKKGIDFQIGHSDFMKTTNLLDCINKKTIPLLMEYFRNRHEEVTEILSKCLPVDMEFDSELLSYKLVKLNYKSQP